MISSTARLHSFVPVSDGDRAKAFYADVLGLEHMETSPFAVVFSVPGGTLRLAITPDFTPQPFTLVGWEVENIATSMSDLAGKGVAFERFTFLPQTEDGVWETPDGAKICWFKDVDGNVLSLTEFPTT